MSVKTEILKITRLVIALVIGVFFVSCEDESDDIPTSFTNILSEVEAGWEDYKAGDYEAAVDHFDLATSRDAAYIEAYNGGGWSQMKLQNFDKAIANFDFAEYLAIASDNQEQLADAYAGKTAIYSFRRITEEQGEADSTSIDGYLRNTARYGELTLRAWSGYNSDHDPEYDAEQVGLLVAQSYYLLQEFENCFLQLTSLDNAFEGQVMQKYSPVEVLDTLSTLRNESGTYFLPAQEGTFIVEELVDLNQNSDAYTLVGGNSIKLGEDNFLVATDTLVSAWDLLYENIILETSYGPIVEVEVIFDTTNSAAPEFELDIDNLNQINLTGKTDDQVFGETFVVRYKYGKPYRVRYMYINSYRNYLYELMEKINTMGQ